MTSPLFAELTSGKAAYIEDPEARAALLKTLTLADLEVARAQIEKEPHIATQISPDDLSHLEDRAEALCDVYRAIADASCSCGAGIKLFSWLFGSECAHHKNLSRAAKAWIFFTNIAECRAPCVGLFADGSG